VFCPECKAEYVKGISRCPQCDVQLVEDQQVEDPFRKIELEVVFKTAKPVMIQIVHSILEDAGISYKTKSEGLQSFLGLGEVKFQVLKEDAETARELLKDLNL